jgi:hypothetical protein
MFGTIILPFDIMREIMLSVDAYTLKNYFLTSKNAVILSYNENFWQLKFLLDFPQNLNIRKRFLDWLAEDETYSTDSREESLEIKLFSDISRKITSSWRNIYRMCYNAQIKAVLLQKIFIKFKLAISTDRISDDICSIIPEEIFKLLINDHQSEIGYNIRPYNKKIKIIPMNGSYLPRLEFVVDMSEKISIEIFLVFSLLNVEEVTFSYLKYQLRNNEGNLKKFRYYWNKYERSHKFL